MDSLPALPTSFELAACGLVTTDVNGQICRANQTFCRWLGYTVDELIGKVKIQQLFSVGARFFHHTHWAPLLQLQKSVSEVQMDLVTKDGSKLPMLVNAIRHTHAEQNFDELAFFIATDRKSYERELVNARSEVEESLASLKVTQEKLQVSQDFLSVAMNSARMGLWSMDLVSKQIRCSPELQNLLGAPVQEYQCDAEQFYKSIHPDDRENFLTTTQQAIQNARNYEIQFRLQHVSGQWLNMEGRGHGVYSSEQTALSIFGIFIDVSESKAAQQKLQDLFQQQRIADKRKDQFLATLSHELRNPLAPMRNVIELMRRQQSDDQFLDWCTDIIERHVMHMTHLVDDLLESSRISHGRLELRMSSVELMPLVRSAIESVQSLLDEANHNFMIEHPDQPLTLHADGTRVIQIIANLLNNAAKYTPKNGKINLAIEKDDDKAKISIQDSGIGIASEQLNQVFDMFSQLKPAIELSHGGLGIGLSLVHGLVSMHHGRIEVHSEGEGKGSTFTLWLPLAHSRVSSGTEESAPAIEPGTSRRILVIDDNVDAAESLALLLRYSGHTTKSVHNGTEGLKFAQEFKPDIILLDIGLPDIDGHQVAKRIRQKSWGKQIILIATTGWGQESDIKKAKQSGFDHHITKPLDFKQLTSIIQYQR